MTGRLQDKVAVITGTGGVGTGRSAALRFAREGAKIVGCDVNTAGAEETLQLVRAEGGTMVSLAPCDIGNEDDVGRLMELAVDEFGGVDILYNNASWILPGNSLSISTDEFVESLNGTVISTWRVSKIAVPYLERRGGGAIVNISSSCGNSPGTGTIDNFNNFFAYGIGKSAVIRLTELMAIDLASKNIRVNCISPGSIMPQAAPMLGEPGSKLWDAWHQAYLIRRPGTGDDIANAALYFASDEASYITGENMIVDGGLGVSSYQGAPLQRDIYDSSMIEATSAGGGMGYAKD